MVLEVEDMPIEIEDDIFSVICPTCSAVVPKIRYASQKNSKSCHSPARPPEGTTDKFSCETCHQSFESVEANDLHEPCRAASNYIPARKNERAHNASSLTAVKTRQRDALARLSTMTTDRITVIYRAAFILGLNKFI